MEKSSHRYFVKLERGTTSKFEQNCAQTERELKKVIKSETRNDVFFNRLAASELSFSAKEKNYKNMPSFFLYAFEYSGNQKIFDFFYKEFPKNISLFFLGTGNPTIVVINPALNTV
jgi:hypothetical protein